MLTIPTIPRGYGPWNFKCYGSGSKLIKNLIESITRSVLFFEKIKSPNIIIELNLKDKENMQILHNKFMNKNEPTDTISIPIDSIKELEEENERPILLGTVFLCWPIIKEDAAHLQKDEFAHLAHIVVHSILHLLGHEHTTEKGKQSMEAKEIKILSKLGVPSPYN